MDALLKDFDLYFQVGKVVVLLVYNACTSLRRLVPCKISIQRVSLLPMYLISFVQRGASFRDF